MDMKVSVENDQPIDCKEADYLHRQQFAEKLATAIDGYTEICNAQGHSDGLVIGLEGAWGSGKTSLLRLLKPLLESRFIGDANELSRNKWSQEEKLKRQKYYVADFNSWLAMDENALIMDFFSVLQKVGASAKLENFDGVMKYAANFLRKNIGMVSTVGKIAGIPFVSEAKDILESLPKKSIGEQKEELAKGLRALGKRWVIFLIDDIDRLQDNEIVSVFKLVKNIADFPNIIYVLAYDKEVVIRALDSVQKGKGKEYLQKVVQFPSAVPEPQKALLDNYLTGNLQKIFEGKGKDFVDIEHFRKVYETGVRSYIRTVRDCKRILNAFFMRYFAGGQECDVGDLLGITALELYEPRAFEIIKRNKWLLTSDRLPLYSVKKDAIKELFERLCSSFSDKEGIDIVKMLFPFLMVGSDKEPLGETVHEVTTKRICVRRCFDMYFSLCLEEALLSEEEITEIFSNENKDAAKAWFWKWGKEGRLNSVLLFLESCLEERCALNNPPAVACVHALFAALSSIDFTREENRKDECEVPPSWVRAAFGFELFWVVYLQRTSSKLSEMDAIFSDADVSPAILCEVLHQAGRGQDWIFDKDSNLRSEPLLRREEFESLKQKLVMKLRQMKATDIMHSLNLSRVTLSVWSVIDEEGFSRFLKDVENSELLDSIVPLYMDGYPNADGVVRRISKDWPRQLDKAVCANKLKSLMVTDAFSRLDAQKQELVRTFVSQVEGRPKNISRSEEIRALSDNLGTCDSVEAGHRE